MKLTQQQIEQRVLERDILMLDEQQTDQVFEHTYTKLREILGDQFKEVSDLFVMMNKSRERLKDFSEFKFR